MRGESVADVVTVCRSMVLDDGTEWAPEPFQVAVIEALCAGVDVVWLEIPEGNGKTTLSAGLALAHLFLVDGAEAPVAASSRDQAGVLLRQATGIVRRSPDLRDRYRCLEGYRRVECVASGGRLQVMAADAATGDGVIPTLAIIDELHRHPDMELFRTWRGKLPKRAGQLLVISTAGAPDAPYELAKQGALEECGRVGSVDESPGLTVARMPGFEMRVHAVAAADSVDDIEAVVRANPLSVVTRAVLEGKRRDPTFSRDHWARFTCGRPSRDQSSAITESEWAALPRGVIPPGTPVAVGADFAWKHDTTALVPLWVPERFRRVFGVPEVLVPPRDGSSLPDGDIRAAFVRLHERNPISLVAMDASRAQSIAEWLEAPPGVDVDGRPVYAWDAGCGLGVPVIEVPQSNTVACDGFGLFMEAVRCGWIEHPHDPEFSRHVLNAVARLVNHDRYRFDRVAPSRRARFQDQRVIDALVAAWMVHWQQAKTFTDPAPLVTNVDDYRMVAL